MKNLIILGILLPGALFVLSLPVQASIENPSLKEYFYLGKYYTHTDQPKLAISNYTAMISKYPNTKQAEYGWLGIGYTHYQLMIDARAELDKAKAKKDASDIEIKQLESSVNHHMNQALSAYRRVIAQFPASKAEAIIGIGQVYAAFNDEKIDEALREFKKVVKNNPEEAGRAQILIGDFNVKIGDIQEAKKAYTTAYITFPEVASFAMLKYASLLLDSGEFAEAVDRCNAILNQMGIDGAYTDIYHPMGNIMRKALAKRGEAERALKNREDELSGYSTIVTRYYGTNVGMIARMKWAEALHFYGSREEAANVLNFVVTHYPKSVWAVRALDLLARLQGDSQDAVNTYSKISSSYPQSSLWVDAQMGMAKVYLKMADAEKDKDAKKKLRNKARDACKAIISKYPLCPEADKAKDFLEENRL